MPGKYPVIVSMTAAQLNDLEDQIGVTHAEHKVKPTSMAALLNGSIPYVVFLSQAMKSIQNSGILVYPNPSAGGTMVRKSCDWTLQTLQGVSVKRGNGDYLDLSALPAAMYILKTKYGSEKVVKL